MSICHIVKKISLFSVAVLSLLRKSEPQMLTSNDQIDEKEKDEYCLHPGEFIKRHKSLRECELFLHRNPAKSNMILC